MHNLPSIYEIVVRGHVAGRSARWFEEMDITNLPNGDTRLRGPVADQAALHGILGRIRDLGLPLVSVAQMPVAGGLVGTTGKEELK